MWTKMHPWIVRLHSQCCKISFQLQLVQSRYGVRAISLISELHNHLTNILSIKEADESGRGLFDSFHHGFEVL